MGPGLRWDRSPPKRVRVGRPTLHPLGALSRCGLPSCRAASQAVLGLNGLRPHPWRTRRAQLAQAMWRARPLAPVGAEPRRPRRRLRGEAGRGHPRPVFRGRARTREDCVEKLCHVAILRLMSEQKAQENEPVGVSAKT